MAGDQLEVEPRYPPEKMVIDENPPHPSKQQKLVNGDAHVDEPPSRGGQRHGVSGPLKLPACDLYQKSFLEAKSDRRHDDPENHDLCQVRANELHRLTNTFLESGNFRIFHETRGRKLPHGFSDPRSEEDIGQEKERGNEQKADVDR
jgi:hypothetical protein